MKTPSLLLETLKLQNFATFKSHEVSFASGLNAIVGETGSGKSLLLDALQLVFGGRADKKAVRHGSDAAIVEAVLRFNDEGSRGNPLLIGLFATSIPAAHPFQSSGWTGPPWHRCHHVWP